MKKGKLYFIFIIITSSFFTSCSDDTTSSNNNNNLITSLRGNIIGLPANARTVKALVFKDTAAYVIATNTIGTNEAMNLTLTTPPQQSLIDINDFINSTSGGINISDPDANVSAIAVTAYKDSTGQIAGNVIKDNINLYTPLEAGYVRFTALYSDRNLNLSGAKTVIVNNDTAITNYNMNLGAGWNAISLRVKTMRDHFFEYEIFSGEAGGIDWYYR